MPGIPRNTSSLPLLSKWTSGIHGSLGGDATSKKKMLIHARKSLSFILSSQWTSERHGNLGEDATSKKEMSIMQENPCLLFSRPNGPVRDMVIWVGMQLPKWRSQSCQKIPVFYSLVPMANFQNRKVIDIYSDKLGIHFDIFLF